MASEPKSRLGVDDSTLSTRDTASFSSSGGETNPADLFTKILTKQPFEKHRKFVLNLAGDTGMEHARRVRLATADASSSREGTGAP